MPISYFIIMLSALIYVALASAFVILLIGKLGIRDSIIAIAPMPVSKLFECDFCLSFWMSLILAVILAIFFREISVLFIPILSTPITRILL